MSVWPSIKAKRLLAALIAIGWIEKRRSDSHRVLERDGWPDIVFAFHDSEEIGPRMLARLAKTTGLRREDLREIGHVAEPTPEEMRARLEALPALEPIVTSAEIIRAERDRN